MLKICLDGKEFAKMSKGLEIVKIDGTSAVEYLMIIGNIIYSTSMRKALAKDVIDEIEENSGKIINAKCYMMDGED